MFEHFQRHQKTYEVCFWPAYIGINDLIGATSELFEYSRRGESLYLWEPFVWEFSSGAAILMLLPLILLLDRRIPIREETLWLRLGQHALLSIPFSLAHVLMMVSMRKAVYAMLGGSYDFGNWPVELFYEYRKDALTYASILAIIHIYRYIIRRQQGEAKFVAGGADSPVLQYPERLLIKKRGREFIVKTNDIEWIEACGNYVNLHIDNRVYPLRETMNNIETRLDAARFARVHRSAIVNLDRVTEIRPLDGGDHRIHLDSGADVSFSRRNRARLKELFLHN